MPEEQGLNETPVKFERPLQAGLCEWSRRLPTEPMHQPKNNGRQKCSVSILIREAGGSNWIELPLWWRTLV